MTEKQQKILEMAKDICRVKHNCNDPCNPISACDALKYAERAVEAGYVKVVRCKECIYAQEIVGGLLCMCGDIQTSYGGDIYPKPDDFCSYGARKEQK